MLALFVYPLGYSLISAFTDKAGAATFDNFSKAFELYPTDAVFTVVIIGALDGVDWRDGDRHWRLSDTGREPGAR